MTSLLQDQCFMDRDHSNEVNQLNIIPWFNRRSLPPELWLEAFSFLPTKSIECSTLVCQSFRHLAQPMLFRCLTFRPSVMDINLEDGIVRYRLRKDDNFSWDVRRLDFCTSSRMASFIQYINIYPIHGGRDYNPSDNQDSNLFLDTIFLRLSLFINLRIVSCRDLCLQVRRHWSHLHNVPVLEKLVLRNCSMIANEPIDMSMDPLEVTCLLISSNHHKKFPINTVKADRIFLISTSTLDTLYISPNTIHHLRLLHIRIGQAHLPLLDKILSQHPPLQDLKLDWLESLSVDAIGAWYFTPLPLLEAYQGPCVLLPGLSTGGPFPNLRRLRLSHCACPDRLLDILHNLGESARRLERLQLTASYITKRLLSTIFFNFQHLRHLLLESEIREGCECTLEVESIIVDITRVNLLV
jgi:hypothetical protein